MRGVGSDGLGAKGGVACLGSAPIYPTIQASGFTPVRVGKTTGANPGGYQAIARGILARGITDVLATGTYVAKQQGSAPRVKGVWELADSICLLKVGSPFFVLLKYFEACPAEWVPGQIRLPNTWRRPPTGLASTPFQRGSRPVRNTFAERAVRLAGQSRAL